MTAAMSHNLHNPTPVPRVSVIIPAYNAAATLAKTLASVQQQTEQDFEVIIIDDGSTDGTRELAQSWGQDDSRFTVHSQRNEGIAGARNHGIRRARAKLVAPLDADDLWHATYLEKLCHALEQAGEETLFAYANFRNIDIHGRVEGTAPVYAVSGSTRNRFLLRNFVGNGSGMVFRREAALAIGGYDARLQHQHQAQGCEDWLLQTQLSMAGNVAAVPQYLVGYRKGPNTMSRDTIKMRTSRYYAIELLLESADGYHTETLRWARGTAAAHCFLAHWRAREWSQAQRWAILAARDDPRALMANLREIVWGRLRKYRRRLWPKPEVSVSALPPRRPFFDFTPTENPQSAEQDRLFRRVAQAAAWDEALEIAQKGATLPDYVLAPAEQLRQSNG